MKYEEENRRRDVNKKGFSALGSKRIALKLWNERRMRECRGQLQKDNEEHVDGDKRE